MGNGYEEENSKENYCFDAFLGDKKTVSKLVDARFDDSNANRWGVKIMPMSKEQVKQKIVEFVLFFLEKMPFWMIKKIPWWLWVWLVDVSDPYGWRLELYQSQRELEKWCYSHD